MNNENLLEKIGMFIFYFAFKFIYVTLILLFLLIYHNSLFDHMLRSPQRSHRKTYYLGVCNIIDLSVYCNI